MSEKKQQSFANAAYGKAQAILREKHQAEFEAILEGIYKDAGQVRKVRLSAAERQRVKDAEKAQREAAKRAAAQEKAQATVSALLSEFPDLKVG